MSKKVERKSKTTARAYRKKQPVVGEERERGEIPNNKQSEEMDGRSSAPNARRKYTENVVGANAQRRGTNKQKAAQCTEGGAITGKHDRNRQNRSTHTQKRGAKSQKRGANIQKNGAHTQKRGANTNNGVQRDRNNIQTIETT